VGARIIQGICELEIHWEDENNTWEPGNYIYSVAPELVMEYMDTLDAKQRNKLLKLVKAEG
jgi:hypothetical protein